MTGSIQLPDTTSLGRVDLAVADRSDVIEFYTDVIGLEVLESHTDTVDLGVDEHVLVRLTERPELPPRPQEAAGLFHLALRVPHRDALAEAARRLVDRNELSGASDHAVSEALYTADPAGNGIEVYCDRPRDEWPISGDTVQMTTRPLDLDELMSQQSGSGGAHLPPTSDLGHIHLEVTDLDRSLDWYVSQLGFKERATYEGARFVAAGGYHHHVGLNVWNHRRSPLSGLGLERFTLHVPDVDVRQEIENRLRAEGVPIETKGADHSLRLVDPDGIEIDIGP